MKSFDGSVPYYENTGGNVTFVFQAYTSFPSRDSDGNGIYILFIGIMIFIMIMGLIASCIKNRTMGAEIEQRNEYSLQHLLKDPPPLYRVILDYKGLDALSKQPIFRSSQQLVSLSKQNLSSSKGLSFFSKSTKNLAETDSLELVMLYPNLANGH